MSLAHAQACTYRHQAAMACREVLKKREWEMQERRRRLALVWQVYAWIGMDEPGPVTAQAVKDRSALLEHEAV